MGFLCRQLVKEMLENVGLDESFAARHPRELSGGQKQRISIGVALLMDPRLVIADEPVSALDVTVQSQILNLLLKLHAEKQMTILFISHDLNVVRGLCSRVMVIYKGVIVEATKVIELDNFSCGRFIVVSHVVYFGYIDAILYR